MTKSKQNLDPLKTDWNKMANDLHKKNNRWLNIFIGASAYLIGLCSGVYLIDFLDSMNSKTNKTIVAKDQTSATLMVVGMNALNDELYDEYELREMLSKANL